MIELYDDYYFIHKACYLAEKVESYRIIPIKTICYLGENADYTRVISLILLLLSSVLLSKLYVKKINYHLIAFFSFNSIFMLPVYYASLISMSFSIFWASLLSLQISRLKGYHYVGFMWVGLIGFFGSFIRDEVFLYPIILLAGYYVFEFLNNKKRYSTIFTVIKKEHLLGGVVFGLSYVVGNLVLTTLLGGGVFINSISNIHAKYITQYPNSSYWIVEIWACLLYIKNALFPLWFSFYSNFSDWYIIHTSSVGQILLVTVFIFIVFGGLFRVFTLKKVYKIDYLFFGLFCFIVPTYLLIIPQSTEWYYITRQMFGTIVLLTFIFKFIETNRWILNSVIIFFLFSSIIQYRNHFSTIPAFYKYEKVINSTSHPYVYERYANFLKASGYEKKALSILREGFKSIPQEAIINSERTYYYWLRNAYFAFQLGKSLKDKDVIRKTYEILTYRNNYFSLISCLQVNKDYQNCQQYFNWKDKFCRDAQGKTVRFNLPIIFTPAMNGFIKDNCIETSQ